MCLPDVALSIECVAAGFDEKLAQIGSRLEDGLSADKKRLLEELEEVHLDRADALIANALQVGIDVGRILGRQHRIPRP